MRTCIGSLVAVVVATAAVFAAEPSSVLWLEAERFDNIGGWSNDSQHVDIMGSPYLLATGVGKPVSDAVTKAAVEKAGTYRLGVRCRDWLPSHSPGQFQVMVGGKAASMAFGKAGTDVWQWVDGGTFDLPAGPAEVRLHDLTGWWGRCDAVILAMGDFKPADDLPALAEQRVKYLGVSPQIKDAGSYDVIVTGGGLAGCAAAVSAARHGCKVALVQDRPVLGGNASSEIQIPVEGDRAGGEFNPSDTGIIEEFYPLMRQTGRSKEIEAIVRAEKNVDLFLNTRATGVEIKDAKTIAAVIGLDVRTGQRLRFPGTSFIDCTGHGWIGFWSGATCRQGEESIAESNEPCAAPAPSAHTMGNSLYTASFRDSKKPVEFHAPTWAYHWGGPSEFETPASNARLKSGRPENYDKPAHGKGRQPKSDDIDGGTYRDWRIEYGGMVDTIRDAEKIRDELFRINIGLWDYAKNYNPQTVAANANRELVWLNYVPGVRESRRIIGDYIMTENDYIHPTVREDDVTYTGWGADIHHPEGFWVQGVDCMHYYRNVQAPVPFRTLYSKDIDNLLMAGRCHSATHIGMGGTRIMRTCCEMGEAVGEAASLIKKYQTTPRGIYKEHITELQQMLLKDGGYIIGVPNRDPLDLALTAKTSASSFIPGFGPENVNNGWNRAVGKNRNAWAPDRKAVLPQWVQLDLPAASKLNSVHVSFATQVDRGIDFAVQAFVDGEWKEVAQVKDNEARRRVLNFPTVKTDKVRLVLNKIAAKASVCEIRIYNEKN